MNKNNTVELIFASHNTHKMSEIQQKIPDTIQLKSLRDIGFFEDIEEPFDTFFENAEVKARAIHDFTNGGSVFSEDSGLVIESLDGRPGVYSARYAGLHKSDGDNLYKVLDEMKDMDNRSAYYLSHICLIWQGKVMHFEGKCHGRISKEKIGSGGFGYDPIFIPDGYNETFGELNNVIKLELSHRSKALALMVEWLDKYAQL